MKKTILFTIILFTMAFINTSCEKDELTPDKPTQTLEQLYPDWVNLTWIKTIKVADNTEVVYPKIYSISIKGNVVTIVSQSTFDSYVNTNTYNKIVITGNQINIDNTEWNYGELYFFEKVNGTMVLNTNVGIYRWIMKIN
jgi:hypothetical protein